MLSTNSNITLPPRNGIVKNSNNSYQQQHSISGNKTMVEAASTIAKSPGKLDQKTTTIIADSDIDFFQKLSLTGATSDMVVRPVTARSLPIKANPKEERACCSLSSGKAADDLSTTLRFRESRGPPLPLGHSNRASGIAASADNIARSLVPLHNAVGSVKLIRVSARVSQTTATATHDSDNVDDCAESELNDTRLASKQQQQQQKQQQQQSHEGSSKLRNGSASKGLIQMRQSSIVDACQSADLLLRELSLPVFPPNHRIPAQHANTTSNLDAYLDFSSSPFTTRFELIGDGKPPARQQTPLLNQQPQQQAQLQLNQRKKPHANESTTTSLSHLLGLNSDSFALTRSRSHSNKSDRMSGGTASTITTMGAGSATVTTHALGLTSSTTTTTTITGTTGTSNVATGSAHDHTSVVSDYTVCKDEVSAASDSAHLGAVRIRGLESSNSLSGAATSSTTNFLRVTEHLYAGSMNSIRNERKLCQLGIEYLIDMTNMRPDELNRQTAGRLPCLCERQHSRLYMNIEIKETTFKALFNTFAEVNRFIQRARKAISSSSSSSSSSHVMSSNTKASTRSSTTYSSTSSSSATLVAASGARRVLIFGKEALTPQVICACAQYLMVEYEMSLDTALHVLLRHKTAKTSLDKCYSDYLGQFEMYLRHMATSLYGNGRHISSGAGLVATRRTNATVASAVSSVADSSAVAAMPIPFDLIESYSNTEFDDFDDEYEDDACDLMQDDFYNDYNNVDNEDDDDDDDDEDYEDGDRYDKEKDNYGVRKSVDACRKRISTTTRHNQQRQQRNAPAKQLSRMSTVDSDDFAEKGVFRLKPTKNPNNKFSRLSPPETDEVAVEEHPSAANDNCESSSETSVVRKTTSCNNQLETKVRLLAKNSNQAAEATSTNVTTKSTISRKSNFKMAWM